MADVNTSSTRSTLTPRKSSVAECPAPEHEDTTRRRFRDRLFHRHQPASTARPSEREAASPKVLSLPEQRRVSAGKVAALLSLESFNAHAAWHTLVDICQTYYHIVQALYKKPFPTTDEKTLKHSITCCTISTCIIFVARFVSWDLFIVLWLLALYGVVQVVKRRKQLMLKLVKNKGKSVRMKFGATLWGLVHGVDANGESLHHDDDADDDDDDDSDTSQSERSSFLFLLKIQRRQRGCSMFDKLCKAELKLNDSSMQAH